MAHFKGEKKTRDYKKSACKCAVVKREIHTEYIKVRANYFTNRHFDLHPAPRGRFPRTDRRRTRQAPLGAPAI